MKNRKKIHFVYKAPRYGGLVGKILNKLYYSPSNIIPPPWRRGQHISWPKPMRSPYSIPANLLPTFHRDYTVRFYDLYEKTTCPLAPSDVFLAAPMQSIDGKAWSDQSIYNVTARTCAAFPDHPNRFIIMPYSPDPRYNTSTNGLIERFGQNLIVIAGSIWTDQWDQSPLRPYVKNLLRLNMAIESADYPRVKFNFNPKGKRRFLYVGHTKYYKNTPQLEALAKTIPGFEGGHIGEGNIQGWKKLANFSNLTPGFMKDVAQEYDIFLNVSSADPQATTILEAMCFGFPVACTPQSGYTLGSVIQLRPHDTQFNITQIQLLQYMEEEALQDLAEKNLKYVQTSHCWKDFCQSVSTFIREHSV